MSVSSEITRINTNVASAYSTVEEMGGTLPTTQNTANLASTISTISTGKVDDVQVNGTSIVTNKVANIPVASSDTLGTIKVGSGLSISDGVLSASSSIHLYAHYLTVPITKYIDICCPIITTSSDRFTASTLAEYLDNEGDYVKLPMLSISSGGTYYFGLTTKDGSTLVYSWRSTSGKGTGTVSDLSDMVIQIV